MIEYTPVYGPLTEEQAAANYESLAHVDYVEISTWAHDQKISGLDDQEAAYRDYLSDNPIAIRDAAQRLSKRVYDTTTTGFGIADQTTMHTRLAQIPGERASTLQQRDRVAHWAKLLFASRDLTFEYDPRSSFVARSIYNAEPLPSRVTPQTLVKLEATSLGEYSEASHRQLELTLGFLASIASGEDRVSSLAPTPTPEEKVYCERIAATEAKRGPLSEMLVEEIPFGVHSYNCIKRAGISTVDQLIGRSGQELLSIPRFGTKSLTETQSALEEIGLSLRSDKKA